MMRGNGVWAVLVLVALAACSGKHRPFSDGVLGSGGTGDSISLEGDTPEGTQAPPEPDDITEDGFGVAQPTQEGLTGVGGVQPVDAVSDQATASCDGDAGSCDGPASGSVCVSTGLRDCSSDLDNDCDGQPDNVADDVCLCALGSVEPCDEHPGLDGRGQCRPGSRTCIAGEGNLTSNWSACEGSVGPGQQDSCAAEGDDTDCDGTDNGGCPCIEGETRPCGPETENGICQRGNQTCVNGAFGQCQGAVFPSTRNCGSQQDNDCDGRPDNTIDNVCTCAIGSMRACGAHPGDGNGQCRAGSQSCEGRANNSTSIFGACTGSVGPAPQDSCAQGNDSNCNGVPNEGCACINGNARGCGPDTDVGNCQRGSQTCVNGTFGQCQGAVFPGARSCGSQQDNDCDGRPDNTIDNVCECIPGQGNGPCSGDANNSRCNSQGQCVPCQTDTDCSLVSAGRNTCVGGVCGVPLLANGAICTANNQCASGRCLDWYRDQDGDGFGTIAAILRACGVPNVTPPPNGLIATSGDCCDTDEDAFPGQALFFNVPRNVCGGFNYDCINGDEFAPSRVGVTACEQLVFPNCDAKLWTDGLGGVGVRPPPCGTAGGATFCGSFDNFNCTAITGGESLSACR
jgi:hypothetical protein